MERSYTWGSPEGVQAVIGALPERYPMELITDDMEALIRALVYVSDAPACCVSGAHPDDMSSYPMDGTGPDDHDTVTGECLDTCWRERASSLLGTIAESVHVDWV